MEERLSNIIENVKDDLDKYVELGIIDDNKLIEWAYKELKFFGNLVCIKYNRYLEVNNYEVNMPAHFNKLTYASIVEAEEIEDYGTEDVNERVLTSNLFRLREEIPVTRINNFNYVNGDGEYKIIKEKFYINSGRTVKAKVRRDKTLTISKYTDTNACSSDIRQKKGTSGETISVFLNNIKTSFREGLIYIEYYGLPEDHDGDLIIKDGGGGDLIKYLETYLIRRYLRKMWTGNGEDLRARVEYLSREERELKTNAMTDLKAQGLTGKGWYKPIKEFNRNKINKFKIR